ncbi:MAG: DUF2017 family protein [Acidimicrobiales bacterium]
MLGPHIKRKRDGRFALKLSMPERGLLRVLPKEAQGLLERPDDPVVRRVFPVAYPGDDVAEESYRDLVGGELVRKHRDELDCLSETADSSDIDGEQLGQWLGALEVLRLMLGTSLDVSEDPEELPDSDPRAPQVAVYRYLSWLQGEVIDALASSLPSGGRELEA